MTVGPFASRLIAPLFSDPAVNAALTDEAAVAAMVRVEAALAAVQGRLGIISPDAAARICESLEDFSADFDAIGADAAVTGVPTVEFVAQLRRHVGGEAATYVHWGATSQDIIDTGFLLQAKTVLEIADRRLASIVAKLKALADAHRATPMAGRTRSQQALPIGFGLKAARWAQPLIAHRARLKQLRPRVLQVQFGGAAGNLSALGPDGFAVADALADARGLAPAPAHSHVARGGIGALAAGLALVAGSLGKMGRDVSLMAMSEVGELADSAGGGSSTLPQKANPIAAETLMALASYTATQLAGVFQAAPQEHERGGPGWTAEWMLLPPMLAAAGGALRTADGMLDRLIVRPERMRANLEASNGLLLAEAASYALSAHMPRTEAQALVKAACREAADSGEHLIDLLRRTTGAPCDWDRLRDPAARLENDSRIVDRIFAGS
ncbi:MAG: 3-carboxy-cis,cis-muconate cycloisomerase [Rhodospirillaceae bacterium]|nr:3-carboxy-cis,cis-muconate cycloisomerase [Rhodospirillaceae bacterium]